MRVTRERWWRCALPPRDPIRARTRTDTGAKGGRHVKFGTGVRPSHPVHALPPSIPPDLQPAPQPRLGAGAGGGGEQRRPQPQLQKTQRVSADGV